MKVVVGGSERQAYDHSYALLIGERSYDGRVWQPVVGAPERIEKVRTALLARGFESENIVVLPDANSDELRTGLSNFLATRNDPNSRILIFYIGHGASQDLYTEKEMGFIVPIGTPDQNDPNFSRSAISMTEVKAFLSRSAAKHTLMIFDSCFAGTVFSTLGNPQPVQLTPAAWNSFLRPRIQIITAGDFDTKVPQDDEFVDRLVEGLSGSARYLNSNVITADDLGVYLAHTVKLTTVRTGSIGKETGGQFMFNTEHTLQPASVQPPAAVRQNLGVRYFKKPTDGLTVLKALDKAGLPYKALAPLIGDSNSRYKTNSLACGQNTDFTQVKALARTLIENGVELRMIYSFKQGDVKRPDVDLVTYLASDGPLATPVLTSEQVDSLTHCPTYFWNGQATPTQSPSLPKGTR